MMSNLNLIHTLFLTEHTNETNWVEFLAHIITQPIVSLILTCVIFLGFLYQLYSKRINTVGIIALLVIASVSNHKSFGNRNRNKTVGEVSRLQIVVVC